MSSSLIAIIHLCLLLDPPPPTGPELGAPIDRRVTLTQSVACDGRAGSDRLRDLEILVAIPRNDVRQKILDFSWRSAPAEIRQDVHGNRFGVFRYPVLEAGRRVKVGWVARVRTREASHRVRSQDLLPLDRVPAEVAGRYLKNGAVYDLTDTSLRKAAREAARGARDALDLAFRINEYVRRHLHYVNDGRWDAAPVTLANGHGSCSEYNFLFTSLCRINGLPARFVGATALRSDGARYRDTLHHRWSEVYLPGYGWYPVDVSRNDGEDGSKVNRSFGRVDAGLLVTMRGDGGPAAPLKWGYVARATWKAEGAAHMRGSKAFVWERVAEETPAAAR